MSSSSGKGDDLKANIIQGEFSIPEYCSSALRVLLEGMLQYQGSKRVTIKEVLKSKWLSKNAI